ncbi:hypothetical protein [Thiofilum flexile]|uniref:hypothetical protein n=1 Tax=Thiofilum flexile TaxID=125627 RepID=UPI00037E1F38|nr:hypothetical protein [Thiofilum flexile]
MASPITIPTEGLLERFLANDFEQIFCEKCMNTFLTNVYDHGDYVILEKFSLGLEYYRDAIKHKHIQSTPAFTLLGVLDGFKNEVLNPDIIQLRTHEEPDYRLIYIMEKLTHLSEADEQFFTNRVHGLNWLDEAKRHLTLEWIEEKYGLVLAQDIRQLCRYFRENQDYIEWDLHGDNLMRRPQTQELVILDPYTLNQTDDYDYRLEDDYQHPS